MKKLIALLMLSYFTICGINCFAQSEIKSQLKWGSEPEKALNKKKDKAVQSKSEDKVIVIEKTVVVEKPTYIETPTHSRPDESEPIIMNSCEGDLTVELVSLVGYRASQNVSITIKYTNHGVNTEMRVTNFRAFNEDGEEFKMTWPTSWVNTITDVPVKAKWDVGKMLPSMNSMLPGLSFKINDCVIEMRNVPIDWK